MGGWLVDSGGSSFFFFSFYSLFCFLRHCLVNQFQVWMAGWRILASISSSLSSDFCLHFQFLSIFVNLTLSRYEAESLIGQASLFLPFILFSLLPFHVDLLFTFFRSRSSILTEYCCFQMVSTYAIR